MEACWFGQPFYQDPHEYSYALTWISCQFIIRACEFSYCGLIYFFLFVKDESSKSNNSDEQSKKEITYSEKEKNLDRSSVGKSQEPEEPMEQEKSKLNPNPEINSTSEMNPNPEANSTSEMNPNSETLFITPDNNSKDPV